MEEHQLAANLNQLLAYLYDSRDCINQALQQLSDMQIKNILTAFINQRRLMIETLSSEIRKLSATLVDSESWRETVQQAYLDIKNILAAKDIEYVVREITRAEQGIIQQFNDVLKSELPNDVKLILRQQITELEGNFSKLETFITLNV